jgi:hypothetical protein
MDKQETKLKGQPIFGRKALLSSLIRVFINGSKHRLLLIMVLYVLIWDLGRTLESTRSEVK